MQGPTCSFKGFGSLARLHQQHQSAHLVLRGHLKRRQGIIVVGAELGQQPLVVFPPGAVAQQIGAVAQQLSPRFQRVGGEPLSGLARQSLLQSAEHLVGFGDRTDAQQSEMVEGKFHRALLKEHGV